MHIIGIFAVLNVLALTTAQESSNRAAPKHSKIVSCHIVTHHTTNLNETLNIENVDFNVCTHLIYFYASLNTNADGVGSYTNLKKLKQNYPHLKVIPSAWGRNFLKDHLKMRDNFTQQCEYTENLADFIVKHDFDGLDLFWDDIEQTPQKYPQTAELMLLVKNLQKSFVKSHLLLTSTFFASVDFIAKTVNSSTKFDFATFSLHHNFYHLMPVNYKKYYTINETINELHIQNVKKKVSNLIGSGVPAAKIILGVTMGGPLYNAAKFKQILNYNFICEKLVSVETKWEKTYRNEPALTILELKEGGNDDMIIFEGSRSIANRVRFVVQRDLAGVAAITMDMDCFRGVCKLDKDTFDDFKPNVDIPNRNYTIFPLINTINDAIALALEEQSQTK